MKITILNGDMNTENKHFSQYITKLDKELSKSNLVERFDLLSMNLKYCTGCWNCWWKTPGKCSINDDGNKVLRSVINSDFLIFASPLYAGFPGFELKKITDRFVGLLHPYIKLVNGETHHRKRYEKYPDFGVILQSEENTDEEDIHIISDIYDRLALNFHSHKKYIKLSDKNKIEDIVYETCNN